ncbi:MAG: M48 family peptidase [Rhodocyclaceae bacterium]|nr:MAG: M48 family peptidase [Rhodocyclaceae bacterium]
MSSRWMTALFALALVLTGCATSTRPGVVGVERQQFLMVSSDTVERMAALSYAQQNKKAQAEGHWVASGPEFDRLLRIEQRLIPQTQVFRDDTQGWRWQLAVIDAPVLNASCAPGGKITFYTGLMRKLALSDDEIAAIMGHEIAHALREHGRERISEAYAQNMIATVAMAATQNRQGEVDLANQFAQYLYVLPNSRTHEQEADQIGLELAARAGFDPRGAISVWRKMESADNGKAPPEFLSTHPSNEHRRAELEALLPRVMPLYEQARRRQP